MIRIPGGAMHILKRLIQAGHEAWVVGGCVRDSLLGRSPGDWDITTSALTGEIKSIFPRTIDTGIKHGTVSVKAQGEYYEVTTYRVDGSYSDGRHPDSVIFTRSLEEDLARRDFTVNAMAYNPDCGIVDIFGGQDDLKAGIIKCVGNPLERFDEDALRMLRALRFAAQLGFEIDDATAGAIREMAPRLSLVSCERIREELVKLLISDRPELVSLASDLGITAVFLPEYDRIRGVPQNTFNHIYDVEKHTLKAMKSIESDPVLRLTMLLHDFGKPETRRTLGDRDSFYGHPELGSAYADEIMRRLRFDNVSRDKVVRLVRWHGLRYDADEKSVRKALSIVGDDIFDDFIKVQRADIMAKDPARIPAKLAALEEKDRLSKKIRREGQCYKLSDLAVGGMDLIQAGIPKGPHIGTLLRRLTERVIQDQSLNEKEVLLRMAAVMEVEEERVQ